MFFPRPEVGLQAWSLYFCFFLPLDATYGAQTNCHYLQINLKKLFFKTFLFFSKSHTSVAPLHWQWF